MCPRDAMIRFTGLPIAISREVEQTLCLLLDTHPHNRQEQHRSSTIHQTVMHRIMLSCAAGSLACLSAHSLQCCIQALHTLISIRTGGYINAAVPPLQQDHTAWRHDNNHTRNHHISLSTCSAHTCILRALCAHAIPHHPGDTHRQIKLSLRS